jgi:mRNA-degrading endonuclease RelE of RelBE toxin-antitoxin system
MIARKFTIEYTMDFERHLKSLRAYDRAAILDSLENQLQFQPTRETRKRKRLNPNKWADWELRVGDLRVLYTVQEDCAVVLLTALGIKVGNRLIIDGEEVDL